ncbi:MAG TPA: MopE-related protein [Chitinophagaceae bacterium]|jgi:uncharacterized repeat protein (TIGR03803 family)|nr:MopE-related protein [Chitinophagaceae bacterium]
MRTRLLFFTLLLLSLVAGGQPVFYGLSSGGTYNQGFLFSYNAATNTVTPLHHFNGTNGSMPRGGLTLAPNGLLYGVTRNGGLYGRGTLFSFDPATGMHAILHHFRNPNGEYPNGPLHLGINGKLYGTTESGYMTLDSDYSTFFSFDPVSENFSRLGACIGRYVGNPVQAGIDQLISVREYEGWYTMALLQPSVQDCGTVVTENNRFGIYHEEAQFSLLRSARGIIYGMHGSDMYEPDEGGVLGAIFRYNPETEVITRLYGPAAPNHFEPAPGSNLVEGMNGLLYGASTKELFSFHPETGVYTPLYTFGSAQPQGGLALGLDGKLYGAAGGHLYAFDLGSGMIAWKAPMPGHLMGALTEPAAKKVFYQDADKDGWGNPRRVVLAETAPAGYITQGGDCEDINPKVYPGAPEICDGLDNDCDGQRDEGFTVMTYYRDADKDGWGSNIDSVMACQQPVGFVLAKGDCYDWNAAIYPGAPELCDGLDNDCDGQRDEDSPNRGTYYKDNDRDGYGGSTRILACTAPPGYTSTGGDCNDSDPSVWPGQSESADGKDNDCDGRVDEDIMVRQPAHTTIVGGEKGRAKAAGLNLQVVAFPNPTPHQFTVQVSSDDAQAVTFRVVDVLGRVVEVRRGIAAKGTVTVGANWQQGTYFLEAVQGNRRRTLKLIKGR